MTNSNLRAVFYSASSLTFDAWDEFHNYGVRNYLHIQLFFMRNEAWEPGFFFSKRHLFLACVRNVTNNIEETIFSPSFKLKFFI